MFKFLRSLAAKRNTPRRTTSTPPPAAQEEERLALSAFATLDSAEFTRRTGYPIRNKEYFLQAVIHRSYLQLCPPGQFQSNERMEFLGDSVLNQVVGEYLYHAFPSAEEGQLSKMRSRLVSRFALADCARRLRLEDFLLLSPSAHQSIADGSESILVDAVEAFVAAIYLDGGYNAARAFITGHLLDVFGGARITVDDNYKSRLLEYSQARGLGTPRYVTIDESGPDHNPVFTVEVQVGGVPVGDGKGGNKKAAEQGAAARALTYLQSKEDGASLSSL
ncbi:MAG: ribonuclease III [Bacteroidota bacterium]|jgi:ribonuclease-3|nr:ribonuclease III [Bacteroidota bacterium]